MTGRKRRRKTHVYVKITSDMIVQGSFIDDNPGCLEDNGCIRDETESDEKTDPDKTRRYRSENVKRDG